MKKSTGFYAKHSSSSVLLALAGAFFAVAISSPASATEATKATVLVGPYESTAIVNYGQDVRAALQRSADYMCQIMYRPDWQGQVNGSQENGKSLGTQLMTVSFYCRGSVR